MCHAIREKVPNGVAQIRDKDPEVFLHIQPANPPRPCPSTYLLAALLPMFKVKSNIFESCIDFFKSLILVILFIFYVFRGYHIMGLQLCKFIVKFNVIFVRWIVTVKQILFSK